MGEILISSMQLPPLPSVMSISITCEPTELYQQATKLAGTHSSHYGQHS